MLLYFLHKQENQKKAFKINCLRNFVHLLHCEISIVCGSLLLQFTWKDGEEKQGHSRQISLEQSSRQSQQLLHLIYVTMYMSVCKPNLSERILSHCWRWITLKHSPLFFFFFPNSSGTPVGLRHNNYFVYFYNWSLLWKKWTQAYQTEFYRMEQKICTIHWK